MIKQYCSAKDQRFIAVHGLTKFLAIDTKDKLMVIRVKFYSPTASASTDDNPTCQWISDEMLPRYFQGVAKKFHDEMKKLHE